MKLPKFITKLIKKDDTSSEYECSCNLCEDVDEDLMDELECLAIEEDVNIDELLLNVAECEI